MGGGRRGERRVLGGVDGGARLEGVLEDGDKEFDEEGGGEGGDAWAGDGALLVEGGVAEGLGGISVGSFEG